MIVPHKNSREHGLLQERRIIDALRRNPMNEFQIAEMLGITRNATTIYITRMRKQKRVRVADWIKNATGRPLPVFGVGPQPDKVYVPMKVIKPKQPDRIEAMRKSILDALESPHTSAELAVKLIRSHSVIRTYIRDLRAENLVRISAWKQTGERNGWAPVYRLGSAKDKARPRALTPSEHHAKVRSDPEKKRREAELRRRRDYIKKFRNKPANPFAALGL